MSGIEGHARFVNACEDMIAAIEAEINNVSPYGEHMTRLVVAKHLLQLGLRYGRAASRLIEGDIGIETYDEEVTP